MLALSGGRGAKVVLGQRDTCGGHVVWQPQVVTGVGVGVGVGVGLARLARCSRSAAGSPREGPGPVPEAAGGAVVADHGHGGDRVGAFGLGAVVAVEVGCVYPGPTTLTRSGARH